MWVVKEKSTVAEFETENEANDYLETLPMEDEDYQKWVENDS